MYHGNSTINYAREGGAMDKIIPYLATIAVSMRLAELGANAISILAVSVTIGLCAEYTLKNFSKKERKGKK